MARPRRAVKPDTNQPQIVADLEACGFLVMNVSRWLSTPDLFVWGQTPEGFEFWSAWEIKVPGGKLTRTQRKFMATWPGAVLEARSVDDILAHYGHTQGE